MSEHPRLPARFNFLTVLIWLVVATGTSILLLGVINRISGASFPISTATPNQTQIYQTIAAVLTPAPNNPGLTAEPSSSPTSTLQPTQAATLPLATQPRSTISGSTRLTSTPKIPCNRAAAGKPIDVTIPDDSLISPGLNFTKTWKLVNSGSCTWTSLYHASLFYGDRMGAPESVALSGRVLPEQSVDISVDMVAPLDPGTYQGNWKLISPEGELFGIGPNGDSPFWVRIIVPESTSSTATLPATTATVTPTGSPSSSPTISTSPTVTTSPTPSASPTPSSTPAPTSASSPTPSPTSTPVPTVQASGALVIKLGDGIDLDSLILNGSGVDLDYQVDAAGHHWLNPVNGAKISGYGSQVPLFSNCESASFSADPLALETLTTSTYLCYRTDQGRAGRLQFKALDPDNSSISLDLLTWALP